MTYGNSCEASEVDIAYSGECGEIPNDNLVSCWDLGVLTNDSQIFLSTDRFFDRGGVDSRIYAQFEIYVAVDQAASEIADALAESEVTPTLETEALEMVLIKPNGDERPLTSERELGTVGIDERLNTSRSIDMDSEAEGTIRAYVRLRIAELQCSMLMEHEVSVED